jgi:hypothetical protein
MDDPSAGVGVVSVVVGYDRAGGTVETDGATMRNDPLWPGVTERNSYAVVHPDVFEILLTHLQPASMQRVGTQFTPRLQVASETTSIAQSATPVITVPPAQVRAWAAANGYAIGVRGRLPVEVVDAFTAASS